MPRKKTVPTPEEFDRLVDEYEAKCAADERPVTLHGLIRHLGLGSRIALDNYKKYEGFGGSVERAKLMVADYYERNLHKSGATGSIFAMKNIAGWQDRQELEHSGKDGGPLKVVIQGDDADLL